MSIVLDLELVKQWAEMDKANCELCQMIDQDHEERKYHRHSSHSHLKDHCGAKIGLMVTNILALSLLGPDFHTLLIHLPPAHYIDKRLLTLNPLKGDFRSVVEKALDHGNRVYVTANMIISWIQGILGIESPFTSSSDRRNWIASSVKGQVVFPHLLETMVFGYEPCLQIVCIPGVLSHLDKSQSLPLRSIVGDSGICARTDQAISIPSLQVGNLSRFGSTRHEWKCRRSEAETMLVHLAPNILTGSQIKINPKKVLEGSFQALFAPECSHARDEQLSCVIEDYYFVHPDCFFSSVEGPEKDERIAIYAVRGNDPLRMMILGQLRGDEWGNDAFKYAVIGGHSCLSCSLNLCRRADVKFLIC